MLEFRVYRVSSAVVVKLVRTCTRAEKFFRAGIGIRTMSTETYAATGQHMTWHWVNSPEALRWANVVKQTFRSVRGAECAPPNDIMSKFDKNRIRFHLCARPLRRARIFVSVPQNLSDKRNLIKTLRRKYFKWKMFVRLLRGRCRTVQHNCTRHVFLRVRSVTHTESKNHFACPQIPRHGHGRIVMSFTSNEKKRILLMESSLFCMFVGLPSSNSVQEHRFDRLALVLMYVNTLGWINLTELSLYTYDFFIWGQKKNVKIPILTRGNRLRKNGCCFNKKLSWKQ